MLQKLLKKFIKEDTTLVNRVKLLEIENDSLHKKLKNGFVVVDPGMDDPIPTDQDARDVYVSRYADFHTDFLEPKLKHMIAVVREQLDGFGWEGMAYDSLPPGMSRIERDAFFRGTSNAFKLLLEYGEQMKNEQMSIITRDKENI